MRAIVATLWLCFTNPTGANFVSWKDVDAGRHGSYPLQKFVSSKVKAPYINFVERTPACDNGLQYLITPRGWKDKSPGPMILDETGTLLWSHHFDNKFGGQAYNLRVQQYKGEDYLTFWLGDDRIRGHGAGQYYMLNASYDIVRTVGAANNKYADLHDFTITPDGTALLMVFEPVEADVRPAGRKFSDLWNQAAWDCLFQEVDIDTGQLRFEWRASDHLNMTLSYSKIETPDAGTREKPFDWVHLNSVDKDELGNYLISARNLHAIIYIDGKTGEIIWILGGKDNYFEDLSEGRVLSMAWQHDAKFVSSDAFPKTYNKPKEQSVTQTRLVTLFDNSALDWDYTYGLPYSRALLLEITYPNIARKPKPDIGDLPSVQHVLPTLSKIDMEKFHAINQPSAPHSVRIIREYINPQHVRSSTQGSVQVIPTTRGQDAHVFVGYGINAVMTQYYGNGTVACDVHFGAKTSWETGDIQSYRAFLQRWVGKPKEPPAIQRGRKKVHVSWNGATEVREWLLQVSTADEQWENVKLVRKTGFETVIELEPSNYDLSGQYVRVQAIDRRGGACANGLSRAARPYRFFVDVTSRLDVRGLSYLKWAIVVLGSFSALFLLLGRALGKGKGIAKYHRLD